MAFYSLRYGCLSVTPLINWQAKFTKDHMNLVLDSVYVT